MAKITRKLMKMFGSSAGPNEVGQFGSLAAASPTYVNDGNPDTIQALAAWVGGWYDAVIGGNSPAIQDMNAVLYVFAYQLCYLFQAGVSEWNSSTTYYIGSLASDGYGRLFISIVDDNTGNALSDTTKWRGANSTIALTTAGVTITPMHNGVTFNAQTSGGAIAVQLPNPASVAAGFQFTVKDVSGKAGDNALTLVRYGAETIEGVSATYAMESPYGNWTFQFDGSNWWLK